MVSWGGVLGWRRTLTLTLSSPFPPSSAGFPSPTCLDAVAAFHTLFKAPILARPVIPDAKRCALRVSLIAEELKELETAIQENDLVEVADALCDIQYVLSGAVLEFGMAGCFKALFEEVQRSNMSKACVTEEEAKATCAHYRTKKATACSYESVDGKFLVYRDEDKKVLKSVEYSPVDFTRILSAAKLSSDMKDAK